jgi:hypothetical protein
VTLVISIAKILLPNCSVAKGSIQSGHRVWQQIPRRRIQSISATELGNTCADADPPVPDDWWFQHSSPVWASSMAILSQRWSRLSSARPVSSAAVSASRVEFHDTHVHGGVDAHDDQFVVGHPLRQTMV